MSRRIGFFGRDISVVVLLAASVAGAGGCGPRGAEVADRPPAASSVSTPTWAPTVGGAGPLPAGPTVSNLVGSAWGWTRLVETEPPSEGTIASPANFTLVFRSDGTLTIHVVCGVAEGRYTTSGSCLALSIAFPGPSDCDGDVLVASFLHLLEQVDGARWDGEALALDLADGAGRMVFERLPSPP